MAATNNAPMKGTKTDRVIVLLKRKQGATLDELIQATAWLPHTVRAAISSLRKKGHTIDRALIDGISRYAISAGD